MLIDDVSIVDVVNNNLEIIPTAFPYTQIPVTQQFPAGALSARAKNVGILAQPNVRLSVTV